MLCDVRVMPSNASSEVTKGERSANIGEPLTLVPSPRRPAGERGEFKVPRQNRVTPFGEIIATPERGAWLGNRGVLHDAQGRIRRPWQLKRWILCVLEFKGRRRTV